jgi:DNA-directed RNA polymerase II subunit RPB1
VHPVVTYSEPGPPSSQSPSDNQGHDSASKQIEGDTGGAGGDGGGLGGAGGNGGGSSDTKQFVSGETVVKLFRQISDADITMLGLDPLHARPEFLLVQVLPVPPLHVRPSVTMNGGSSEDDLTHQLVNVIKSNLSLQQAISNGEPMIVVEQFELALQHNVAAFMDNEIRGMPQVTQRSGRPLKTIAQRLKGKELIGCL